MRTASTRSIVDGSGAKKIFFWTKSHKTLLLLCTDSDAPWCDLRATHASAKYLQQCASLIDSNKTLVTFPQVAAEKFSPLTAADWCSDADDATLKRRFTTVKGRNEPCHQILTLAVMSVLKSANLHDVAEVVVQNSLRCFPMLQADADGTRASARDAAPEEHRDP